MEQNFATRLRMLRAKAKKTQSQVAAECGVDQTTVSAWENGQEPSIAWVAALCDFYKVSADYLVGRTRIECGLVPGAWIVDLDECENPSGKKNRFLATEIPANPAIVDRAQARHYLRDARKKLTGKKESNDEIDQP